MPRTQDYRRLAGQRRGVAEALALPEDELDDFVAPKVHIAARPADFERTGVRLFSLWQAPLSGI
ncbi:hypothetical protein [Castellaniella caeni]|uniref:hypothetical protein n=1 Tax=Castellaniella caeni TaxID=266123 RepID=UPI000C9F62EC|nr:hypothetical protein [Castellaniella caeni]